MMGEFHFLRPWWLLVLLFPLVLLWFASRSNDIRNRWKGLISPDLLESLVIEPDRRRHMGAARLMAAMLAVAIFGIAGPTWRQEASPFVSDSASLVIAVDLSTTMDTTDITPSRIERAKLKIHDILAMRSGARTAIIAYAGSAHLVVPLTEDASLIESYTDALSTRIMPKAGKDTSAALKAAQTLLDKDGAPGTILLLTDGVEDAALASGITIGSGIVLLGVGAQDGKAGFDTARLKKFGQNTGASVATITDTDADVRWVAQRIRTNFTRQTAAEGDRWQDLGWYLLLPTVLLFALSFRRGWVVRTSAILLAARLLAPETATASGLADMWMTPDQQGRRAFERQDFVSALQLFRDPLWRGVALYRAGRFQDAVEALSAVDTPESWFNRGNALLHVENFEDAVAAYRNALGKHPDWPEAEANLAIAERLLKQQQEDEDAQPQDPNEKPDSVQIDDKGKKGKTGQVDMAEQTAETWIMNIQVSPADLMARKFAIELEEQSR